MINFKNAFFGLFRSDSSTPEPQVVVSKEKDQENEKSYHIASKALSLNNQMALLNRTLGILGKSSVPLKIAQQCNNLIGSVKKGVKQAKTTVGKAGIQTAAYVYKKVYIDESKIQQDIHDAFDVIQDCFQETDLFDLFKFSFKIIEGVFEEKANAFNELKEEEKDFTTTQIYSQKELILKLLRPNLAKGFAKLAEKVNAHRYVNREERVPKSSISYAFEFFREKLTQVFDESAMVDIENNYLEIQEDFNRLKGKLFTGDKFYKKVLPNPSPEELVQKYILLDSEEKNKVFYQLFPGTCSNIERAKNIEAFRNILDKLHLRFIERNEVYVYKIVDEILLSLFPNKEADIDVPYYASLVFNTIREGMTTFVHHYIDHLVLPRLEKIKYKRELNDISGSPFFSSLAQGLSADFHHILPLLLAPEKVIAALSKKYKYDIHPNLAQVLCFEIQQKLSPENLQKLAPYIEGILVKMFLNIAKKHQVEGKETAIVLIEKLTTILPLLLEVKSHPAHEVAQTVTDALLKDFLGIESRQFFADIPAPLDELIYVVMKEELFRFVKEHLIGVSELNESQAFSPNPDLQVLAQDASQWVLEATPAFLNEKAEGETIQAIPFLQKHVELFLEHLAAKGSQFAQQLLSFNEGKPLKETLEHFFAKLNDPAHAELKGWVQGLLSKLILGPLNLAIEKIETFEGNRGEKLIQNLMVKSLDLFANHLNQLRSPNAAALHPAIPKGSLNFEKTLEAISVRLFNHLNPQQLKKWQDKQPYLKHKWSELAEKEDLNRKAVVFEDLFSLIETVHLYVFGQELTQIQKNLFNDVSLVYLFRQDADQHKLQRKKIGFGPIIHDLMLSTFPNGADDLFFLFPKLRSVGAPIIEENILPNIFLMVTEQLLAPKILTKIALTSLQKGKNTLLRKLETLAANSELDPAAVPNSPAFNQASGHLLDEVMKVVTLPGWLKWFIVDKEGKVSQTIQETMGASLKAQLTPNFIMDNVRLGIKKAVERNAQGHFSLKFDPSDFEHKKLQTEKECVEMRRQVHLEARECIDVGLAITLRRQWANAQSKFDKFVANNLGEVGLKFKKVLDRLFSFIFFKILGTIFSILFSVIKPWAKERFYSMISLDKNVDVLMDLFTANHEDLIFKFLDELREEINRPQEGDELKLA